MCWARIILYCGKVQIPFRLLQPGSLKYLSRHPSLFQLGVPHKLSLWQHQIQWRKKLQRKPQSKLQVQRTRWHRPRELRGLKRPLALHQWSKACQVISLGVRKQVASRCQWLKWAQRRLKTWPWPVLLHSPQQGIQKPPVHQMEAKQPLGLQLLRQCRKRFHWQAPFDQPYRLCRIWLSPWAVQSWRMRYLRSWHWQAPCKKHTMGTALTISE